MALILNGSANTIGGLANGGLPDGCILDADINGMAASKLTGALPAISGASLTNIDGGKILQVVSTTVTAAQDITMSANDEDTLISRTYTPTVSSSNALIQVSLHLDMANSYGGMFLRLLRDSTVVSQGDAASNRRQVTIAPDLSSSTFGGNLLGFTILDTAISGTSQVTYKVNIYDQHSSGGTYRLNTGRDDSDNVYILRSVSTLTVMEVGA